MPSADSTLPMKKSTSDWSGVLAVIDDGLATPAALKLETRVNTEVGFAPPHASGGP